MTMLALGAVALVACGDDGVEPVAAGVPAGPVASTDVVGAPDGRVTVESCGRTIVVDAPPTRAIALEQGATEVMLSLGLAESMVGTSYLTDPVLPELQNDYDRVPVLAGQYPAPEIVLEQEPDFLYSMLGSAFTAEVAGERAELERRGVPAYLAPTACEDPDLVPAEFDFEQLFDQYRDVAAIFGVAERGAALVDEQRSILQAAVDSVDIEGEPSIVWFYSTYDGAPYVGGSGGLPETVSRLVGGVNAFSDASTMWPEVSWEEIADRDPDVIVLADLGRGRPGDSADDKLEFLRTDPVASKLSAVIDDRIVVIPGSEMDPSVRSVRSVATLAEALGAMDLDR